MRIKSKTLLLIASLLWVGGCATTAPPTDIYINFPKAQEFAASFKDGSHKIVKWVDSPQGLVCLPADDYMSLLKYERTK